MSFLLFTLLKEGNIKLFEQKIQNVEELLKMKGFISLYLDYALLTKNDLIINKIYNKINMKRDIIKLLTYYINDKNKCIELFKKLNIHSLTSDDIIQLINNKQYYLLLLLNGSYLKVDMDGDIFILNKCKIHNNSYLPQYLNKINDGNNYLQFLDNNFYDIIVDGGNLIHKNKGKCDYSLLNKYINNSIIILNEKHKKKIHNIKNIYFTKKNIYDDIYVIIAFLYKQCRIITNDKYTDLIKDDIYLKNILYDYTFSHLSFSNCVQVINNIIYIPANNNTFISLEY